MNGAYRDPVGVSTPGRILVICTGNICRSPFIEHVLRDGLDRVWGPGQVVVSSAGTHGLTGEPMTAESAAQLGVLKPSAEDFRARRLSVTDLCDADVIITATRAHRSAAVRMVPTALRRTVTLAEVALAAGAVPTATAVCPDISAWLRAVSAAVVAHRPALVDTAPADLDLEDPYGHEVVAYQEMAQLVSQWMPSVLAVLSPADPTEAAAR